MNQRKNAAILLLLAGTVTACTWVEPDAMGAQVALVNASVADSCTRLGTTTATTREEVGILDRSDKKVAAEVLALARNSAAEMGGNTIVEDGKLEEGAQRFIVYRCEGM